MPTLIVLIGPTGVGKTVISAFDYKNFKKFVDKNDYLAYSSVEIRKKEVHTMAILFTVSMLAVAGGMICSHAE